APSGRIIEAERETLDPPRRPAHVELADVRPSLPERVDDRGSLVGDPFVGARERTETPGELCGPAAELEGGVVLVVAGGLRRRAASGGGRGFGDGCAGMAAQRGAGDEDAGWQEWTHVRERGVSAGALARPGRDDCSRPESVLRARGRWPGFRS